MKNKLLKQILRINLRFYKDNRNSFSFSNNQEIKKGKDCYYKILNLSVSASDEEIKKQYFKLAKENHPDSRSENKVNKYSFEQISEAYDVLSNTSKREVYDSIVLGTNVGKRLMSNKSIYEDFSKNNNISQKNSKNE